jgi:hypothetical protein
MVTCLCQVLNALADTRPRHKLATSLAAHLREVADAITLEKHEELQLWLKGGILFDLLLSALKQLIPIYHGNNGSNAAAAEVCSAAAACLHNILAVAEVPGALGPDSASLEELRGLACCADVVKSVVIHGMLNSAASQQLPKSRALHIVKLLDTIPEDSQRSELHHSNAESKPECFWTLFRVCTSALGGIIRRQSACAPKSAMHELQGLATEDFFGQLLAIACDDPCGELAMQIVMVKSW